MIKQFQGEYRFLSNFYPSMFTLKEISYPTVEHYYQSNKADRESDRKLILECKTPGQAKRLGSVVKLISIWDEVKDLVMETGVRAKFLQNTDLKYRLLNTKNYIIVEGNYWHDNYWGTCYCNKCKNNITAKNKLGRILMDLRNDLK